MASIPRARTPERDAHASGRPAPALSFFQSSRQTRACRRGVPDTHEPPGPVGPGADSRRAIVRLGVVLALTIGAFSIGPLWNSLNGYKNKDYNLWYRTGQLALHGHHIYPTDHRPFPFMYPPSCAFLFAVASTGGEVAFVALLVLVNSLAWLASILLSVQLATGRAWGRNPLLYALPTLVVIPFVHDMYLLGQPSLVLLACLLGAFASLRRGWPWFAGALIGLAAAIKAYPLLAVGYLVWRRQWKATGAVVVSLVLLLLVLPMPLRGTKKAWDDLSTWTRGMVLKYDEGQIAQRPERSYSFKNQSLIALANRLLRSIPADGERKDGWQVNLADLDFRTVNRLLVISAVGLGGFYVLCMPPQSRRNGTTDALETAMLLLLILIFTPLSFDYSYVWLIYPLTVGLHLCLEAAADSLERRARVLGLVVAVVVFALSLPFRRTAQAYGNLVIADLLLMALFGWEIVRTARPRNGVTIDAAVPGTV